MMMANQQNPKAIQKWLGHRSITETFDTYGHLWPDDGDSGRQVVRQVLGFLGGAADPQCPNSVQTEDL
jgi:integrase